MSSLSSWLSFDFYGKFRGGGGRGRPTTKPSTSFPPLTFISMFSLPSATRTSLQIHQLQSSVQWFCLFSFLPRLWHWPSPLALLPPLRTVLCRQSPRPTPVPSLGLPFTRSLASAPLSCLESFFLLSALKTISKLGPAPWGAAFEKAQESGAL